MSVRKPCQTITRTQERFVRVAMGFVCFGLLGCLVLGLMNARVLQAAQPRPVTLYWEQPYDCPQPQKLHLLTEGPVFTEGRISVWVCPAERNR